MKAHSADALQSRKLPTSASGLKQGWISDPTKQHQNNDNDQDGTQHADPAMSEAVAVPAKAATEAAEEHNNEKNNEDGTEWHDHSSIVGGERTLLVQCGCRHAYEIAVGIVGAPAECRTDVS